VEDYITPQEQQPGKCTTYNSSSKNSCPSSPSEQHVCIAEGNSKVKYTFGWYSASAGIKLYAKGNNKVNKVIKL
jgi:hypothetical protein